ncbi:hypothetical protein QBC39DRAFT_350279 [Podospora conica]|nr:hypothetical protein QBC39DRAFT_350279 [Schizothecium conicum]
MGRGEGYEEIGFGAVVGSLELLLLWLTDTEIGEDEVENVGVLVVIWLFWMALVRVLIEVLFVDGFWVGTGGNGDDLGFRFWLLGLLRLVFSGGFLDLLVFVFALVFFPGLVCLGQGVAFWR